MFGGIFKLGGLAVGAVIAANLSYAMTLGSLPPYGYDLVRMVDGRVYERVPVFVPGQPKIGRRSATTISASSTWFGLKFHHAMPDGGQVTCHFIATIVQCDDPWVLDRKLPKPGDRQGNPLIPRLTP